MMIEEVLVPGAIDKRKFVTNRMRAIDERLSGIWFRTHTVASHAR
jgi:hypothetical protein